MSDGRKLASIQKIISLEPITFLNSEGQRVQAEAIEKAKVLGWDCVVKKGEFSVGDLAVFFEIDSILPFNPWTEFLKDKNRPDKQIRLKTIKMKGQLSQGLLVPISKICNSNGAFLVNLARNANISLEEGSDLTELLGIIKYEPVLPECLQGKARGTRPGYIPKTDEERIQSNPNYIQMLTGSEVYVSQKMDGSSFSAAYHNKEFHVSSRNLDLLEGENSFWKMAKKYNIEQALTTHFNNTGHELCLQGEVCGPSIQGNRLKLAEPDLYIFNMIDITSNTDYTLDGMSSFCNRNNLQMVPVLYRGVFNWTSVEELLEEAKGFYPSGHEQEGIVIRPCIPEKDPKTGQRLSFKVINNNFLLKIKE